MPRERSTDLAALILRIGLGIVFVDFGIEKLVSPEAWLMFVPPTAARVLTEGPGLIRTLQTQALV
jgi:uncharacterized membrane protein YphA (DoxX/SURF4 family)